MIDPITAQKIKDAADIVEVVGDYVHLIRRGANYMGLCPFHNERTPSFSVSKRKNFCYCFSCKKGGSPVNFIMEKEGLSYHDALLHLAKKYGIEVVEKEMTDEERQAHSEREAMLVANEWAMLKMERDLFDTQEGRDVGLTYLYGRGVTEEAIRKFHLGYALDKGSELTDAAKSAGYDISVFKNLGLVGTSKEGREYDRFRGRVIFPIINSAGKVIAFGGRDLKGGLAKYINSPESQIYKKSNELYGIFQARADIVREDKCFLVEGYLDVIGMWQSGMRNTVASSGTALTDGQIALIHRFTENITLIYDGDPAGIKASLRGIDMLLSHKMKVKVLLLPDGDDPDSFARKHTPEEFRQYVADNETDIIRFKAQVLLSDIKGDPQKRIDALNSVVESIAHIQDPISRDVYIQECSRILGVQEQSIAKSVARFRGSLIDKWKKERTKKEFPINDNAAADTSNLHAVPNAVISEGPNSEQDIRKAIVKEIPYPLQPLEKAVIEYCIKYGFLDLWVLTEDNEETAIPVIDYVREELEADETNFSVPVYAKIFDILNRIKDSFYTSLDDYTVKLQTEIDIKRKEGISLIGSKDLSLSEIERAEKKLEKELDEYYMESIRDFSKDYPGKVLASHENDEIRNASIELIREKHQLSNIYQRDNNVVEKEEDRIDMLVPRAMTEWKNELLNQRIKSLFQQFREISGKGDGEGERKLMLEINSLMKFRSEVAKDIGDRIISPGLRK